MFDKPKPPLKKNVRFEGNSSTIGKIPAHCERNSGDHDTMTPATQQKHARATSSGLNALARNGPGATDLAILRMTAFRHSIQILLHGFARASAAAASNSEVYVACFRQQRVIVVASADE
jgi:hypothetical protein